jgi:hypothetical protein
VRWVHEDHALVFRIHPPATEYGGMEILAHATMNDHNEDLNQPDLLRDEASDEALEAAASVSTGGLPTLSYSTHCFGCPSRPISGENADAR